VWSPDDGVGRVLVVTAHPDDVDFGTAGTVAAFTAAGVDVTYCVVTNGEAGGSDRAMARADMAALRQDEQRAAAAVVGVSDVRFLGHPDGMVQATTDLRRDISRVIRDVRPQRVVTQSPDRNWDFIYASHPDHLAAGEAAVNVALVVGHERHADLAAVRTACLVAGGRVEAEGLEPWTVPELWLMGPGKQPGIAVDTTTTVERKVAALLCHKSQIPDPDGVSTRILDWARAAGETAGLTEGSSAELFRVIPIP